MNNPYNFKYRRRWLWKVECVIGHAYDSNQDKMQLFYADGGIKELCKWKNCEVSLGVDWVLAIKRSMEQKAGQPIQLAVETR